MSDRITGTPQGFDEFEKTLGQLQPRASGISRERLMYLAGQRSAQQQRPSRRRLFWPLATVASWLITATVVGLGLQSSQEEPDVPVANEKPAPTFAPEEIEPHPSVTIAESQVTPVEEPSATPQRKLSHRWRGAFALTDDDLMTGRFSRVSAIGGQRFRRPIRPMTATDDNPGENATVPDSPATYRRLMEQYLNEQPGFETEGDLL